MIGILIAFVILAIHFSTKQICKSLRQVAVLLIGLGAVLERIETLERERGKAVRDFMKEQN